MPKKPPAGPSDSSAYAAATGLAAAMLVLTMGGYWLDQKFHTRYIFTLIGGVLALAYSFFEAWRLLNPPKKPPQ